MFNLRKTNFFEKLLLIVGIAVGVIGFYLIDKIYRAEGYLNWFMVVAIFSWLTLIFLIIISDTNEDLKEEFVSIQRDSNDHLAKIESLLEKVYGELRVLTNMQIRKKK
ncbi:hypothetical protein JXM83_00710 [Candidatus Woesearchaeota archaeon]|nr:hypothetical protein [Candidatus Woesearchaeota archaeon]